jgi:hypothetical protein
MIFGSFIHSSSSDLDVRTSPAFSTPPAERRTNPNMGLGILKGGTTADAMIGFVMKMRAEIPFLSFRGTE